MQFKVKSITKSIEIWDHQPKKNWGEFQLLFEIEPMDPWQMALGENEILCSDYFEEIIKESNKGSSRKKLKTYLSLLNRETISVSLNGLQMHQVKPYTNSSHTL